MQLNSKQLQAVQSSLNQNVKVLAGPGSGKTSGVIVPRYEYLIDNGIQPESIVIVAFNTTMADELKARILKKFPLLSDEAQSQICTINAFCYRQLKSYWYNNGLPIRQVLNGWKLEKLMKETIESVYGPKRKPTDKEALEMIARFKIKGLPESKTGEFFIESMGRLAYDFIKVYRRFEQQMRLGKHLTFIDQVYLLERLLIEKVDFRNQLQSKISHVLLDEAQDATGQALRILITVSQEVGWNEIYKEME